MEYLMKKQKAPPAWEGLRGDDGVKALALS